MILNRKHSENRHENRDGRRYKRMVKRAVDGIEERVEGGVDERIEVDIGERTKPGEDQREETCDGNVRCICACNMEKGKWCVAICVKDGPTSDV